MSARSCQLCGKPLSRIWVGAEGDFCSREHRNQFRLRQGMGRLQEANKVANVMRRREQLRPLSNILPPGSTARQRGFLEGGFTAPPRPATLPQSFGAPTPARLASSVGRFLLPTASRNVRPTSRRQAPGIGFNARRIPVLPPRAHRKPPVRVDQAPAVGPRTFKGSQQPGYRQCGMALPSGKRIIWNRRATPGQQAKLGADRARTSSAAESPVLGQTLRVSCARGFRPGIYPHAYTPSTPKLEARIRRIEKRSAPTAVPPNEASSRLAESFPIPIGGIFCPAAPLPATPAPPSRGVALPVPRPKPASRALPAPLEASRRWQVENPSPALPQDLFQDGWRADGIEPRSYFPLRPPASTGRGSTIHLVSPFVPQDSPSQYAFSMGQNGSKEFE